MRSVLRSKFARVVVVAAVFSVLAASGTAANAASKTITCYKGTAVKKVSGANPKCAAGWTTKKPTTKSVAKGVLAFSGTYKGKIAILWSDTDVQATSVTGSGTGDIFGLGQLTGSGSAKPSSQCSAIKGSGVLSGSGGTLKVSFDPLAKGCGTDSAAPTDINISGNALVTGGTGKFAGATGTLKVKGSFPITSTTAGSSESNAFTFTLSGNVNTK